MCYTGAMLSAVGMALYMRFVVDDADNIIGYVVLGQLTWIEIAQFMQMFAGVRLHPLIVRGSCVCVCVCVCVCPCVRAYVLPPLLVSDDRYSVPLPSCHCWLRPKVLVSGQLLAVLSVCGPGRVRHRESTLPNLGRT